MKNQSLTNSISDIETRSKGNHMYPVRNLVTSIFWEELHLCLMNVRLHSTTSASIESAVPGARDFQFSYGSGLEMDMTHLGILRIIYPTKTTPSLLAKVTQLWIRRKVSSFWRLSLLFLTSNFHSGFLSSQLSTRLCEWRYTKISSTNCNSSSSNSFFCVIAESLEGTLYLLMQHSS